MFFGLGLFFFTIWPSYFFYAPSIMGKSQEDFKGLFGFNFFSFHPIYVWRFSFPVTLVCASLFEVKSPVADFFSSSLFFSVFLFFGNFPLSSQRPFLM